MTIAAAVSTTRVTEDDVESFKSDLRHAISMRSSSLLEQERSFLEEVADVCDEVRVLHRTTENLRKHVDSEKEEQQEDRSVDDSFVESYEVSGRPGPGLRLLWQAHEGGISARALLGLSETPGKQVNKAYPPITPTDTATTATATLTPSFSFTDDGCVGSGLAGFASPTRGRMNESEIPTPSRNNCARRLQLDEEYEDERRYPSSVRGRFTDVAMRRTISEVSNLDSSLDTCDDTFTYDDEDEEDDLNIPSLPALLGPLKDGEDEGEEEDAIAHNAMVQTDNQIFFLDGVSERDLLLTMPFSSRPYHSFSEDGNSLLCGTTTGSEHKQMDPAMKHLDSSLLDQSSASSNDDDDHQRCRRRGRPLHLASLMDSASSIEESVHVAFQPQEPISPKRSLDNHQEITDSPTKSKNLPPRHPLRHDRSFDRGSAYSSISSISQSRTRKKFQKHKKRGHRRSFSLPDSVVEITEGDEMGFEIIRPFLEPRRSTSTGSSSEKSMPRFRNVPLLREDSSSEKKPTKKDESPIGPHHRRARSLPTTIVYVPTNGKEELDESIIRSMILSDREGTKKEEHPLLRTVPQDDIGVGSALTEDDSKRSFSERDRWSGSSSLSLGGGGSTSGGRGTSDASILALGDNDAASLVTAEEKVSAWSALVDEYSKERGYANQNFKIIISNKSDAVLSPPLMESLQQFLPEQLEGQNFWRRFSSLHHGSSLQTLLRHVRGSHATLMAIETVDGHVFGAFNGSPWRKNWGYFGNGECFVWRMRNSRSTPCFSVVDQARLETEIEVYVCTMKNDCYQACTNTIIAVGGSGGDNETDEDTPTGGGGGGGGFAIALTEDLSRGTTEACPTFDSPALTCGMSLSSSGNETTFAVRNVEMWSFTPFDTEEEAERNEMAKLFCSGGAGAGSSIPNLAATGGPSNDLAVVDILLGVKR